MISDCSIITMELFHCVFIPMHCIIPNSESTFFSTPVFAKYFNVKSWATTIAESEKIVILQGVIFHKILPTFLEIEVFVNFASYNLPRSSLRTLKCECLRYISIEFLDKFWWNFLKQQELQLSINKLPENCRAHTTKKQPTFFLDAWIYNT